MKVSIIIPTLDEARWIGSVLEAIARQDVNRDEFEVIVIDCGSGDGTVDIAREWGARVESVSARSSYVARNRGIEVARADWLAFLDGDCIPDPTWLSEFQRYAAGGRCRYMAGRVENNVVLNSLGSRMLALRTTPASRRKNVELRNGVAAGNMFVHRTVFDRTGLFSAFPNGSDSLKSRSASEAGFRIGYVECAVVRHQCDLSNSDYLLRRFRLSRAHHASASKTRKELPSWGPPGRVARRVAASLRKEGHISTAKVWLFLWLERLFEFCGAVVGQHRKVADDPVHQSQGARR